jgi:hypothetical protein
MKTKNDELWLKSMILGQEFDRYILEHPRFAEKIPSRAEIVLLPTYDRQLREYNLRNAQVNTEPDRQMVYIEINRLRPRRSLIVRPKLKVVDTLNSNQSGKRRKKALSF